MIELTHQADHFRQRIRESLRKQCEQCQGCRATRVAKHDFVYTSGQRAETVYSIERGQVKLVLPTPEGKECLLAVRTQGDLFGELCLAGQDARLETAVAMEETVLRQVSSRRFLECLRQQSLLEGLVQYLALRISEQQEVIAMLATEDSEHRLATTLLRLGDIIGKSSSGIVRIEHRISHEELSRMVGTTRPRIGIFLKKFRELGLIRLTAERFLVIDEARLRDYLMRSADAEPMWTPKSLISPLLAETAPPSAPVTGNLNTAILAGRNRRPTRSPVGY